MTRLLAVPLDASDVFLMTFMILQDSYMEPTRVGSDYNGLKCIPPKMAKQKESNLETRSAKIVEAQAPSFGRDAPSTL